MARLISILIAMSVLIACAERRDAGLDVPADCRTDALVQASDVEVTARRVEAVAGIVLSTDRLNEGQEDVIRWSLDRFDEAGLKLPPKIDIVFDHTRSMCHGEAGECRPNQSVPAIHLCGPERAETPATVLDRRIVLLHELAHVWHWSRGDGSAWPDYSTIVGGEPHNGTRASNERTEERVAMILSWGLLDQKDRPILEDMSCQERYLAFETLTDRPPLGPLEPSCYPT